ncbi:MAG: Bax inhibitor-1 family protein [Acidobacteria bacterium]|nr:Bax inhibitor-1 family protein [Acidobacteriota bacterium]
MDYQQSWQNAQSGAISRLQFVRQVYLWLMAGFGVALVGAVGAFVTVPFWAPLLQSGGRVFMFALIIGQFAALWIAGRTAQTKPLNIATFGLATGVSGFIAGMVSLMVASQSGMGVVLSALGLTALAFLTLTVVAFVSKKDFSFLRSFVVVGLVIGIGGSFIAFFFNLPVFSLVISGVIVLASSAKILWDTSAMLRTADLSNPVGFALSLFVNLYNIFISLLNILSGGRRR